MNIRKKQAVSCALCAMVAAASMSGAASAALTDKCGGMDVAVANVESELLIRDSASATGEVIGYLPSAAGVIVRSMDSEWTKIQSGSISGYVKTDYLAFGEKADYLKSVYGVPGAVASWNDVKVFSDHEDMTSIVGSVNAGEGFEVLGSTEDWVEVQLANGNTGYVPVEDVNLTRVLETAVSVDEAVPQQSDAAVTYESAADESADDIYVEDISADESYTDDSYAGDAYVENTYADDTYTDAADDTYADVNTDDTYTDGDYTDDAYADSTYTDGDYTDDAYADSDYTDSAYTDDTYTDNSYTEGTGTDDVQYSDAPDYGTDADNTVEDYDGSDIAADDVSDDDTDDDFNDGITGDEYVDLGGSDTADVSADDLDLLAALIYCEAGNQSEEGKIAVGQVVMNRVASDDFADTIHDVIYESGQFTPAYTGWLDQVIGSAPQDCYDAAAAALNGEGTVGDSLYFNGGTGKGMQIGDHQFY